MVYDLHRWMLWSHNLDKVRGWESTNPYSRTNEDFPNRPPKYLEITKYIDSSKIHMIKSLYNRYQLTHYAMLYNPHHWLELESWHRWRKRIKHKAFYEDYQLLHLVEYPTIVYQFIGRFPSWRSRWSYRSIPANHADHSPPSDDYWLRWPSLSPATVKVWSIDQVYHLLLTSCSSFAADANHILASVIHKGCSSMFFGVLLLLVPSLLRLEKISMCYDDPKNLRNYAWPRYSATHC